LSIFENFENPYLQDGGGKIGSEGIPELEITKPFKEKYSWSPNVLISALK
jgi:hypothetical protein